jgi:hypothetical protein
MVPALQREQVEIVSELATAQTTPQRCRRTARSLLSKDRAMYTTGAVFQPELITLMKTILDDATAMLPEAKRTSTVKAEIASYILACAAKGGRNSAALRTAALLAVIECSERRAV